MFIDIGALALASVSTTRRPAAPLVAPALLLVPLSLPPPLARPMSPRARLASPLEPLGAMQTTLAWAVALPPIPERAPPPRPLPPRAASTPALSAPLRRTQE